MAGDAVTRSAETAERSESFTQSHARLVGKSGTSRIPKMARAEAMRNRAPAFPVA